MDLLTPEQIERIYSVTDAFGCNRNLVVVPMSAWPDAVERVLPDGKIFLRAPDGARFDAWVAGLPERVAAMSLARARRPDW
jgi:hypothetical protein